MNPLSGVGINGGNYSLTVYAGTHDEGSASLRIFQMFSDGDGIQVKHFKQYGGRVAIGSGGYCINASGGSVTIGGGSFTDFGDSGICASTITLGCPGESDSIQSGRYVGTVNIAEGQTLVDENDGSCFFTGTQIDTSAIAGKKLQRAGETHEININLTGDAANGTVTVNGQTSASGAEGTTINLIASPASGYGVKTLAVTYSDENHETRTVPVNLSYADGQKYYFDMPAADVSVTASFGPSHPPPEQMTFPIG